MCTWSQNGAVSTERQLVDRVRVTSELMGLCSRANVPDQDTSVHSWREQGKMLGSLRLVRSLPE